MRTRRNGKGNFLEVIVRQPVQRCRPVQPHTDYPTLVVGELDGKPPRIHRALYQGPERTYLTNFYRNHFGMIISSVVTTCISLVMATSAVFVGRLMFTLPLPIENWSTTFLVISLAGITFFLVDWFFALRRKAGLRPKTLPHVLVENFVATLFFNTAAIIALAAIDVLHNPEIEAAVAAGSPSDTLTAFAQGVLHDWPIMFIISYVFTFFVTKVAIRVARQAVGGLKPPHLSQSQFQ